MSSASGNARVARTATSLLVLIGMAVLCLGGTASAASTPKLLTQFSYEPKFAIRPAVVGFTGDGTGYLGGRQYHKRRCHSAKPRCLGKFHWEIWGQNRAKGKGVVWINDCKPDCADGTFHSHRGHATASRVRNHRYTRLNIVLHWKGGLRADHRVLKHYHQYYFWALKLN